MEKEIKKIIRGYRSSYEIHYNNGKVKVRLGDCGENFIIMNIPLILKRILIYYNVTGKFYYISKCMGTKTHINNLDIIGKDAEGYYIYADLSKEIDDKFLMSKIPDIYEIARDAMTEILLI